MKTLYTLLFMVSMALSVSNSGAMDKSPVRDMETQTNSTGIAMDADARAHERFMEEQKTARHRVSHITWKAAIEASSSIVFLGGGAICLGYLTKKVWEYKG